MRWTLNVIEIVPYNFRNELDKYESIRLKRLVRPCKICFRLILPSSAEIYSVGIIMGVRATLQLANHNNTVPGIEYQST